MKYKDTHMRGNKQVYNSCFPDDNTEKYEDTYLALSLGDGPFINSHKPDAAMILRVTVCNIYSNT